MITTKIKFEKVSKPSQLEKLVSGPGKIAMMINTIGKSSQATEFLTEIELRFRPVVIRISSNMAAIIISICRLVMFFSPKI